MSNVQFGFLDKVGADEQRPLWSVMIPTYNCAAFLEDTLQSVMQQALPPGLMEIIVVDDCSKDDPEAAVAKWGRGRVRFVRQPHNLGHTGNFETCLSLSKGKLVHLLHGDDRVLPGFYATYTDLFEKEPTLMAAFCRCHFIDEHNNITNTTGAYASQTGIFTDFFNHISRGQIIQTPAMVVKREVYEKIGMFNRRLSWCEDWEMWARIGREYPVGFINEILAEYRTHTKSNSGKYVMSGENIRDIRRGIVMITSYIKDPAGRKMAKEAACNYYANFALNMATHYLENHQKKAARNQLQAAFLMSKSPRVNFRIIKLYFKSI